MCGIIGYVSSSHKLDSFIVEGLRIQQHRGPDATGELSRFENNKHIGFGHNRLSIIDLSSAANQPMLDKESGISLVFNGEIYNFKQLRKELEKDGAKFVTQGDTEVILQGYKLYGEKFIPKLRGMFAIAIWDPIKDELHLWRDHLGKKPVFWRANSNTFKFASDINTLKENSDQLGLHSIQEYFTYLYVPSPNTIYEDISCLSPGEHLVYKNGKINVSKYWQLRYSQSFEGTFEEACETVESLLSNSIKNRLISDRPIGVFLSGGLDSSLISAIAAKEHSSLNTYALGYEIEEYAYDERKYAELVAKHIGSNHTELVLPYDLPDNSMDILSKGFGQPFGNPTAILTYLLTQKARGEIVVGLVGDGADEIFMGYPRYKYSDLGRKLNQYTPNIIGKVIQKGLGMMGESVDGNHLKRRIKMFSEALTNRNFIFEWASYNRDGLCSKLVKNTNDKRFNFFDSIVSEFDNELGEPDRSSYLDLNSFVPSNLLECADRMSMLNSFELRAPFLDVELVEYCASLPQNFKLRNGDTKAIARTIARKYLPTEIIERPKRGFNPPVGLWFKNKISELSNKYVENDTSEVFQDFLNKEALEEMISMYKTGKKDLSTELWGAFMFINWNNFRKVN